MHELVNIIMMDVLMKLYCFKDEENSDFFRSFAIKWLRRLRSGVVLVDFKLSRGFPSKQPFGLFFLFESMVNCLDFLGPEGGYVNFSVAASVEFIKSPKV